MPSMGSVGRGKEVGKKGSWVLQEKVKVKSLTSVRPFATPWTGAYQAPQSMDFSRQEC